MDDSVSEHRENSHRLRITIALIAIGVVFVVAGVLTIYLDKDTLRINFNTKPLVGIFKRGGKLFVRRKKQKEPEPDSVTKMTKEEREAALKNLDENMGMAMAVLTHEQQTARNKAAELTTPPNNDMAGAEKLSEYARVLGVVIENIDFLVAEARTLVIRDSDMTKSERDKAEAKVLWYTMKMEEGLEKAGKLREDVKVYLKQD